MPSTNTTAKTTSITCQNVIVNQNSTGWAELRTTRSWTRNRPAFQASKTPAASPVDEIARPREEQEKQADLQDDVRHGTLRRRGHRENSGVAEGNARAACGGRHAAPPAAATPAAIRSPPPVCLPLCLPLCRTPDTAPAWR